MSSSAADAQLTHSLFVFFAISFIYFCVLLLFCGPLCTCEFLIGFLMNLNLVYNYQCTRKDLTSNGPYYNVHKECHVILKENDFFSPSLSFFFHRALRAADCSIARMRAVVCVMVCVRMNWCYYEMHVSFFFFFGHCVSKRCYRGLFLFCFCDAKLPAGNFASVLHCKMSVETQMPPTPP